MLKETNTPTRPRIEPGSPDPESDALTIRPVRPPFIISVLSVSLENILKLDFMFMKHYAPTDVNQALKHWSFFRGGGGGGGESGQM